jgi:hypothetical protein
MFPPVYATPTRAPVGPAPPAHLPSTLVAQVQGSGPVLTLDSTFTAVRADATGCPAKQPQCVRGETGRETEKTA